MAGKVVRREAGAHSYFMGIMCYMGVLSLVPLITNRNDEFIHFHAKQGVVIWMWSVMSVLSLYIPGFGKLFFSSSAMFILLASVIGVVSVLFSRAWKLPIIHSLSAKI